MGKYHIFEVWAYKGGELNTSTNLSKEVFITTLAEPIFLSIEDSKIWTHAEIIKKVSEFMDSEFIGDNYARDEAIFSGRLYKSTSSGELEQVYHEDFLQEIVLKIKEWYEENDWKNT